MAKYWKRCVCCGKVRKFSEPSVCDECIVDTGIALFGCYVIEQLVRRALKKKIHEY